jgi:hypothetical protein
MTLEDVFGHKIKQSTANFFVASPCEDSETKIGFSYDKTVFEVEEYFRCGDNKYLHKATLKLFADGFLDDSCAYTIKSFFLCKKEEVKPIKQKLRTIQYSLFGV